MKTIVVANQKGGAGKTTFAANLSVTAENGGHGPIALIDTDPQHSLADWWDGRESPTPAFVRATVDTLGEKLRALESAGYGLVIIDTPPQATATIQAVISHADLVLIPTRPSPLDLRAVGATVALVEAEGKRMVFVVNGAANRARITADAAISLSQHGTVSPVTIFQRTLFAEAMIDGRVPMEIEPDSKAGEEMRQLWTYIKAQLRKEPRK